MKNTNNQSEYKPEKSQWEKANSAIAKLEEFNNTAKFEEANEPEEKYYQVRTVIGFMENPEWIIEAMKEVKGITMTGEVNIEFYYMSADLPSSAYYGRELFIHHLSKWVFDQEHNRKDVHEQIMKILNWAPYLDSDEETAKYILDRFCKNRKSSDQESHQKTA